MGCNGGLMNQAFEYINVNKGIDSETSYSCEAKDLECRFKKEDVGSTDTGYIDITSKDENTLQQAVATLGPISVAIGASHSSFQLYKSGSMYFTRVFIFLLQYESLDLVYNERACLQSQLDHGILATGYGTDCGVDYWLVKNRLLLFRGFLLSSISLMTVILAGIQAGGNGGYIKMMRNKNNQ